MYKKNLINNHIYWYYKVNKFCSLNKLSISLTLHPLYYIVNTHLIVIIIYFKNKSVYYNIEVLGILT